MFLSLRFKIILTTIVMATIAATSVGAVSIYSYHGVELDRVAQKQEENIRTAAEVFQATMPELGINIQYDNNKSISKVIFNHIPSFSSHEVVDRVGRITGQTVTIFAWDEESKDFWRRTTILSRMIKRVPWGRSLERRALRMSL